MYIFTQWFFSLTSKWLKFQLAVCFTAEINNEKNYFRVFRRRSERLSICLLSGTYSRKRPKYYLSVVESAWNLELMFFISYPKKHKQTKNSSGPLPVFIVFNKNKWNILYGFSLLWCARTRLIFILKIIFRNKAGCCRRKHRRSNINTRSITGIFFHLSYI